MPRKSNEPGPSTEAVAANIRRLRSARGISKAELSRRLDALGRPMSLDVLTKVESSTRAVDVDDLVALAVVFAVNPNALLLPFIASGDVEITAAGMVPAINAWRWAEGKYPIIAGPLELLQDDQTSVVDFQMHARPKEIRSYILATPEGQRLMYEELPEEAERVNRDAREGNLASQARIVNAYEEAFGDSDASR